MFILVLEVNSTSFGTTKGSSISEDGRLILMEQEKNQEKEISMFTININSKDILVMEKEMDLEFWSTIVEPFMLDNGLKG